MQEMMLWILKMNIIAAITITVTVILGKVTKRKYSSRWKYYMWLAVMLFLLIPVNFSGSHPINVKLRQSGSKEVTVREAYAEKTQVESTEKNTSESQNGFVEYENREIQIYTGGIGIKEFFAAAFVIWAAGIWLLGTMRWLHYYYSLRSVRRWSYAVDDMKILGLYFFLCKRKHIKRPPRLLLSDDVNSPMLAGLLHPGLYLPKEDYTLEELEFVFSHELSHYSRRDLWYKMLMMVVLTIHWFNPALYWMQHEANKDIENLCDGRMVEHYNAGEKKLYGQFLLKVAAAQNHVPYLTVSLNDSKQVFKDRILYMRSSEFMKTKLFPAIILSMAMVTSQFLVGCSMEVTADTKEQKKEVIAESKEFSKKENSAEISKSTDSKSDKKTVAANIGNKDVKNGAIQVEKNTVPDTANAIQVTEEGNMDKKQQNSGSGQDVGGSNTDETEVEATEPEEAGSADGDSDSSDNSEKWFYPDEIELTGEQKTLYYEDAYSGVYVRRGTDGCWYDTEYWKYSDLGGGAWICNVDGSRLTEEKPEFSPEKAYSQAVIADESGQNQKTIYFTVDNQWRTEDGEYWDVLGYGDFSGPNGELWHVLD